MIFFKIEQKIILHTRRISVELYLILTNNNYVNQIIQNSQNQFLFFSFGNHQDGRELGWIPTNNINQLIKKMRGYNPKPPKKSKNSKQYTKGPSKQDEINND